MKGQIRSFLDKRSCKEYNSSKPVLQDAKGFALRKGREAGKERGTYKGTPIRLAHEFSLEMLQARREWQEVMKSRGLQPRLLYPARLSIKMEGQIRSFPDKRTLKEYTSCKTALQEMLKGLPKSRK